MTPEPSPVKTRRRYDITGRRDRAHRAQAHILEVARELFLRDGYAATTVAASRRGGRRVGRNDLQDFSRQTRSDPGDPTVRAGGHRAGPGPRPL